MPTARRTPREARLLPLAAALGVLLVIAASVAVAWAAGRETPAARVAAAGLPQAPQPANLGAIAAATREPTPTVSAAASFDASAALAHVRALTALGPRGGGSVAESRAVEYVRAQLTAMGYESRVETVPLPGGKTTRNVVALKDGSGPGLLVVGAHLDSKPPAPGANDNASGVGVMLELARIYKSRPCSSSIEFVAFGCEETMFPGSTEHHFGSRAHYTALNGARPGERIAMISVDMVGVGSTFAVRTMGRGPQGLRRAMLADAKKRDVKLTYVRDPGKTGSSDHEAWEFGGMPAAWIQWREDPNYHTARDVASRISRDKVTVAGRFVAGFIEHTDEARIIGWYAR